MALKKKALMSLVAVLVVGILVSQGYPASEKFDLKLNLKKGQKLGIKMVSDQKISQTVMGQQQKMNQMTAMGMRFEVLDVDADGNMSIKTTYQNIHIRMEGPMGVMEYDSTKPEEAGAANPMSAMYKAMLGQSFVMKLAPKGEILEIKGMDEMIEKMVDQMAPDDAIESHWNFKKQDVKEMMKNFINEDKMREMSGTMLAALPPKPVGIGEAWTNQISIPVGFPMEIDITNTLTGHKEGIITIETNAKIESGDQPKPIEMGPMKMTMRMQGEQKGTTQIDKATGWTIRTKTDIKFSGEMEMEPNEQMPQGMTIPVEVEGVTTVEPMAVK